MNRRKFIEKGSALVAGMSWIPMACQPPSEKSGSSQPPAYLKQEAALYQESPRQAALQWFSKAKYGMFLHYGLYSLVGRGEWLQYDEKVPIKEYAGLKESFTAKNFNADLITDLALEGGMEYLNITTRHHDSFCLWDTAFSDFKSTNSPAKRDLIAELSEQCQKKGLGPFLYYSHGRDWKHPHAPNNGDWDGSARPQYADDPKEYAYGDEHDLSIYVEFMSKQIEELLNNYGSIAGIWLDGIATPRSRPEKLEQFKIAELYDQIHSAQPQVLISYKQGLLGTEDFFAPERDWKGGGEKLVEICDTLQPGGIIGHNWGYNVAAEGIHRGTDYVLQKLEKTGDMGANLLLNIGPMGDGTLPEPDVKTLQEVGKIWRA